MPGFYFFPTMNESAFLDAHRKAIAELGLHSPDPAPAPHYQISTLKPEQGRGFVDLYDFGRVILGRGNYVLSDAQVIDSHMPLHFFGVNILLAGRHRLEIENENAPRDIHPPQIALRKGEFGKTRIHLPAGRRISIISLDFVPALCAQLAPQGTSEATAFFHDPPATRIHLLPHAEARLLHHARHLLQLPCAQNELDLLRLEGAALTLLAALLAPEHPAHTRSHEAQAVNHAQQILDERCQERLTIPRLARRVGLNECDLKRAFKRTTGMTIAAYAREARMRLALSLLAGGASLQQAATQSGYDNVQYFSKIFVRHFGYHPKNHSIQ